MKFTVETAAVMGRKGGQASTPAKRRAARANGRRRRKPHPLFSSRSDEWATPAALYAALDAEFGFTLDPCCTVETAMCASFYTQDDDGLAKPWSCHHVFLNPPYGAAIGEWMAKAWRESRGGALVVALVPARTDTAWWHYVVRADEVRFLRGRLTFGGAAHPAPFPSAVAVWRPAA